VVEAAGRLRPALASALYPLPAAKAAMEKQASDITAQRRVYESWDGSDSESALEHGAAQAIIENEIISKAIQLLGRNNPSGVIE
jgi:hypothetical protein